MYHWIEKSEESERVGLCKGKYFTWNVVYKVTIQNIQFAGMTWAGICGDGEIMETEWSLILLEIDYLEAVNFITFEQDFLFEMRQEESHKAGTEWGKIRWNAISETWVFIPEKILFKLCSWLRILQLWLDNKRKIYWRRFKVQNKVNGEGRTT